MILLLVYGSLRASYDLRWSGWAAGDAQNMIAARHFIKDGYFKHYLLTYYHPGYLGNSKGTEIEIGYYTHWPPFSAVFLSLALKLFGDSKIVAQVFAILLSALALLFWYLLVRSTFTPSLALTSSFFIGTAVSFLDFIDSCSPHFVDNFFRFGTMFLIMFKTNQLGSYARIKQPVMTLLIWVMLYLGSFNSLESIIYLQLFYMGYVWIAGKKLKLTTVIFFFSAPALGVVTHFAQNMLVLGGFWGAFYDLASVSGQRGIGKFSLSPVYDVFKALCRSEDIGLSAMGLLLLWLPIILTISRGLLRKIYKNQPRLIYGFLILLAVCPLPYLLIFAGHLRFFPGHFLPQCLPFVSVCFALVMVSSWGLLRSKEFVLGKKFVVMLILLIISWPILLPRIKYLSHYPNLVSERSWRILPQHVDEIKIAKMINGKTEFGSIVMVPFKSSWFTNRGECQISPVLEFYADHSLECLGSTQEEFDTQLIYMFRERDKVKALTEKLPTLYALLNENPSSQLAKKGIAGRLMELFSAMPEEIAKGWYLFKLQ